MKPEAPLHALADTVAEVEASTLYESLSNFKAEALVEVLHDKVAKDASPNKLVTLRAKRKPRHWLTSCLTS